MRARARVVAAGSNGAVRYDVLRSDPPLLLRPTPDALQLVGGAAGPLGGDQLMLEMQVGDGAQLCVRSVAATIVLPGPARSEVCIEAHVGPGGSLDWAPEPVISVAESDHAQRTTIELATGSELRWHESLVLGRTGERPGALCTSLRVVRHGRALTHQDLRLGRSACGWNGPASIGDAGAVVSEVVVGAPAPSPLTVAEGSGRAGRFPIADDAVLRVALGADLAEATACLTALDAAGVDAP